MNTRIAMKLAPLAKRIGTDLDVFFSLVWWWRFRRQIAERKLTAILEDHGDESMWARRMTERYRDLEFAVDYWRPAPRPVQQVIQHAAASGVPVDALRLVALSRDLRAKGANVVLRRSRLVAVLSWLMAAIALFDWAELCTIALLQHGHVALKCTVIVVVTAINVVMWRGWSLWCGRPESVVRRWGEVLERSCNSIKRDNVAQFPSGRLPN